MTASARRTIFWARKEAHQQRRPAIGTEHLLYGVLREDPSLLKRLVGPAVEQIHRHLSFSGERQADLHEDLPLSGEARQVLNCAAQEAESGGDWNIGTYHLVTGLLLVPSSRGAKLLLGSGLTLDKAREEIGRGRSP